MHGWQVSIESVCTVLKLGWCSMFVVLYKSMSFECNDLQPMKIVCSKTGLVRAQINSDSSGLKLCADGLKTLR